ncbi:chalcone isomerase family protein [Bordetella avium]|uniref:chalcone isomerase family protein n=1 Tax=Bordetella avium TaxID=521 RepID=UPI0002E6B161|nr:chalcone isomerase family protein [Bordetella avium]AZY49911.1 hypothetical protein C0J09_12795 [Bordetella avium]AZY53247.1 hypothetical protein C0J07_12730 [Bordetella avium]RIQ13130.1 hypothetical protein D0432_11165 [Bordetella avium]RIQ17267.1 hypothetical protein D0850_10275 [Bordetella avium]RIQ33751.1 hypothetical protein D0849_09035 [Bordetella avium]
MFYRPSLIQRCLCAATLALSFQASAQSGIVLDGIAIPKQVIQGEQSLPLIGAGLCSEFIFNIYLAALYARPISHEAQALIAGPGPRRLHLQFLRDISASTLEQAVRQGLEANHSAADVKSLKPAIDTLSALLHRIGQLSNGDIIDLAMEPGAVTIFYNGQSQGRIDDTNLAAALLRIWLGDNPAQASLKEALLGQN